MIEDQLEAGPNLSNEYGRGFKGSSFSPVEVCYRASTGLSKITMKGNE